MDQKVRCQSCGMPLSTLGFFGTGADGSENKNYCKFCYQKGAFTQPDQTLKEMVDSSVNFMTKNLGFEKAKARAMSEDIIPKLKRWKKS